MSPERPFPTTIEPSVTQLVQRKLQAPDPQRRFVALAAAIRRHEAVTGNRSVARRPRDHAPYRRLAELEASPAAGNGAANGPARSGD